MMKNTTKTAAVAAGTMLFDDWFDPIEDAVRETVRGVIERTLHGAQASQPSRPCAGAAARGNIERLQGYDLRRHEAGDCDEAHGVNPQVAPKVQGRRR